MSIKTAISWTHHTFNIAWGCTKVSPGCAHCYADTFSKRVGLDVWGPNKSRRTFGAKHWREPLAWNLAAKKAGRVALVFSSSMCDLFEDHPTITAEREKLWPLIRATPWLHWQLLTKRADRIAANLPKDWGCGYPNVWLGVSVESPEYLGRVTELRKVPARIRFISYEPALADISLAVDLDGIHWIIFGGESGPGYREPKGWQEWAQCLRGRCDREGVAFFFKQSPAHRTEIGTTLGGETVQQFPLYGPPV